MSMFGTMTQYLNQMGSLIDRKAVKGPVEPLVDRCSSVCLQSPGMVISAGSATTAKTGAADTYLIVNGILVKVAASTTLPVLTGINAGANQFNVACFFVDAAGTVTALGGVPGATIALTKFPQFPKQKALLGFLLITNGASVFTGGTTPLDTATTVYVNGPEGFDPYVLIG